MVKIKDGRALIVRPLKPEDKEGLVRFYTGLTLKFCFGRSLPMTGPE
jgi:hypothetical protein